MYAFDRLATQYNSFSDAFCKPNVLNWSVLYANRSATSIILLLTQKLILVAWTWLLFIYTLNFCCLFLGRCHWLLRLWSVGTKCSDSSPRKQHSLFLYMTATSVSLFLFFSLRINFATAAFLAQFKCLTPVFVVRAKSDVWLCVRVSVQCTSCKQLTGLITNGVGHVRLSNSYKKCTYIFACDRICEHVCVFVSQ